MAKKAQVKCPRCEQHFYREDCEFVQVGRRYYHAECFQALDGDEKKKQQIHETVQKYLGSSYSKQKVTKQIKDYVADGKTLDGILNAVIYWFDYKNGAADRAAGGIGIIGYIYNESEQFWNRKHSIKQAHQNLDLSCYDKIEQYEVTPTPITKPKRVKLFDLD